MNNFNTIQLATFGEEIKITTPSRLLKLKAIVEPDTQIEHLQTVQINHQSLLLYIDETLLKNKSVERRQEVIVRGFTYTINEIGDDLNGMAVMRVSRT
jgi:hypothetical protein